MRASLSVLILIAGAVVGLVSYFFFAAPLGTPSNEGFSNPGVPFAATFFVAGIALVFLSALVYELLPEKSG